MRDKGMSLVEIITVVAIISILAGAAGYGISLSSGKPAEKCARSLVSSIDHARTAAMGKNSTTITISREADGISAVENVTSPDGEGYTPLDRMVGGKGVDIVFGTGGDTLTLEFDRANGALKSVNGSPAPDKVWIDISKSGTERTIIIYALTGKIEMKAGRHEEAAE